MRDNSWPLVKRIWLGAVAGLLLIPAYAQRAAIPDDPRGVLKRAAEIRREVSRAAGEDCMQSAYMITSSGIKEVREWCAAIRPFGNPLYASDILLLFQARADSNRTGKAGPMSGDAFSVIINYCGSLLVQAGAREAIPVLGALLHDPSKEIRRAAAFLLFAMGAQYPDLRHKITSFKFSRQLLGDVKAPPWLHVYP
jgi:HEAT repeat protein